MTSVVSSRFCRGASVALGAVFVAAGSLLTGAPTAGAAPSTEAVDAIDSRYAAFGGATSLLGDPAGEAVDIPGGVERDYAGGAIYYSKDTGAHVMYGAILDRYKDLGGPVGSTLGFPKNDESDTGDGTGRFNDFATPEGASMYWSPQWGASVIKGRVLEAWRQSGGITGPFGYPSADTAIADGVQTGKFVGPEGTEIQWSQAAGLVTVPDEIAATIPGFGGAGPTSEGPTSEGTTSVTKPSMSGTSAVDAPKKSSKWWWIPVGVAVLALLGGLLRLLTRKPAAKPVKVAAQRAPEPARKVVAPPPPAPPAPPAPPVVKAPPAPPIRPVVPAPQPPAPPAARPPVPPAPPVPPVPPVPPAPPKPPAKVVPLVKTPPPAPKPVTPPPPPAPRPVVAQPPTAGSTGVVRPTLAEPPKATIHSAPVDHDVSPVIKYESHSPAETTIQVTYENNAVGDNQKSAADKSDTVPDSQQL